MLLKLGDYLFIFNLIFNASGISFFKTIKYKCLIEAITNFLEENYYCLFILQG